MLVIVAAYGPTFHAGFIWDDDTFLTSNALIKARDGLRSFWFTTLAPDYWPVTSSDLWLEWRLWGAHAAGYHATNLILHALSTFLLWATLRRLHIPGAYLAALLFAVHPVNVESVAWITQRKNLLALCFYIASTWLFLASETGLARRLLYALSILAFALAMLSKASVAILPLVLTGILLVTRVRPLRWVDAGRLVPYYTIAIVLVLVNLWFQGRHPAESIRHADLLQRILAAAAIVCFYVYKALVPLRLAFFYPKWEPQPQEWWWWLPLTTVVAVTVLLWLGRRGRSRSPLLTWLYYCAALIPVLGLTDIYFMQFSLVADHYQHVALIGIVALAGWAWAKWQARSASAFTPRAMAAAVVCILTVLSWRQCLIYRDAETLYRQTLEENPAAWLAENNLGLLLEQTARPAEARRHIERALLLNPACAEAENNLGLLDLQAGAPTESIVHYRRSLALRPEYAEAHNNLGNALRTTGDLSGSIAEYERALQVEPNQPGMHFNLARALSESGRIDNAVLELEAGLQIDPDDAAGNYALGLAKANQGDLAHAVPAFRRALQARPDFGRAHADLGVALARQGQTAEALQHLETAAALLPGDPDVRANLRLLRAHLK